MRALPGSATKVYKTNCLKLLKDVRFYLRRRKKGLFSGLQRSKIALKITNVVKAPSEGNHVYTLGESNHGRLICT